MNNIFALLRKKKIVKSIQKRWAKIANEIYSSDDWSGIKSYYHIVSQKSPCSFYIDDVTWHDLDMDDVFRRMNHTLSSPGEEYLYALLRVPLFERNEMVKRERLVEFFRLHPQKRIAIQLAIHKLGKNRGLDLSEWLFDETIIRPSKMLLLYRILAIFPILTCAILFLWKTGIFLVFLSFSLNMFLHFWKKARNAPQIEAFNHIARLISCAKILGKMDIPELQPYLQELRQAYQKVKSLSGRSFNFFHGGGAADPIIEYLRILSLRELIDCEIFIRSIINKSKLLQTLYLHIGFLDAMLAIASYQASLAYFTVPLLTSYSDKKHIFLQFEDLFHPLLENPVSSTLTIDNTMLITGSNASGKSTFLKTVALNAILAQTIVTVHAHHYAAIYFKVLTSMALRDNMYRGESYFIVEAKSMKRLIDQINGDIPCLCIIDEILRGTNTVERIAAASEFLRYLSTRLVLCLAATHDYELLHFLAGICSNYHFREEIVQGKILFDYKIRTGYSISFNALKILELLQYPLELVKKAEIAAEKFKKNKFFISAN